MSLELRWKWSLSDISCFCCLYSPLKTALFPHFSRRALGGYTETSLELEELQHFFPLRSRRIISRASRKWECWQLRVMPWLRIRRLRLVHFCTSIVKASTSFLLYRLFKHSYQTFHAKTREGNKLGLLDCAWAADKLLFQCWILERKRN